MNQDFLDLLSALSAADARFLVVGAYAPRIDGVDFAAAWPDRIEAAFGPIRCGVIGLADLLTNKRASGRPQDVADVDALERLSRLKK
jgi:hypothetical protein